MEVKEKTRLLVIQEEKNKELEMKVQVMATEFTDQIKNKDTEIEKLRKEIELLRYQLSESNRIALVSDTIVNSQQEKTEPTGQMQRENNSSGNIFDQI